MQWHWPARRTLNLWAPALIGITVMALAAVWGSPWIRFLLFAHHWFYFISAVLLFNPVVQTFSQMFLASPEARLERQIAAELSRKWRQGKGATGRTASSTQETAAERLVRLRHEKAEVDEQIVRVAAETRRQAE